MRKLFYLAALALCAACDSNEDNWQPGDAVPTETHIVYFSSDNPAVIGHLDDDNTTFRITLERVDTVGELTVPIVVTESTGHFELDNTVTFADSESLATLTISYAYTPGMSLSLKLGDGFGNPYLEQEGTVNYKCNVAMLKPFCKVNYKEDSSFGDVESYIYNFEGMNQFRFTNFMDSKVDLDFTVSTIHYGLKFNANDLHALRGDFVPVNNKYDNGDSWFLYDTNNDEYPVWTPTGWDKAIYFLCYWAYSDDYARSYSYIDFRNVDKEGKPRDCYFWGTYIYYDEEATAKPETKNVYYTLDFDLKAE